MDFDFQTRRCSICAVKERKPDLHLYNCKRHIPQGEIRCPQCIRDDRHVFSFPPPASPVSLSSPPPPSSTSLCMLASAASNLNTSSRIYRSPFADMTNSPTVTDTRVQSQSMQLELHTPSPIRTKRKPSSSSPLTPTPSICPQCIYTREDKEAIDELSAANRELQQQIELLQSTVASLKNSNCEMQAEILSIKNAVLRIRHRPVYKEKKARKYKYITKMRKKKMCLYRRPYQTHTNLDFMTLFYYITIRKNIAGVARQFNICESTLRRHYHLWKNFNKPDEYDFEESRGRMCLLTDDEQRKLYNMICIKIEKKQFVNDFTTKMMIEKEFKKTVSPSVISRFKLQHHLSSIKPSVARRAKIDSDFSLWIDRCYLRSVLSAVHQYDRDCILTQTRRTAKRGHTGC